MTAITVAPPFADRAEAVFENALQEAIDYKGKNPGVRPAGIGLEVRKLSRKGQLTAGPELMGCRGGFVPNCFSTLPDQMDPFRPITTLLQPWRAPAGKTPAEATADIRKVLNAYPPGQGGIDQGGFRLLVAKPGYVHAQFASLSSLVDEVEFAPQEDGRVLVRSGSRQFVEVSGQKEIPDGGSNAKRLNYIAAELRKLGWTAPEITKETHPEYFKANRLD